jgi:hypothetical protein
LLQVGKSGISRVQLGPKWRESKVGLIQLGTKAGNFFFRIGGVRPRACVSVSIIERADIFVFFSFEIVEKVDSRSSPSGVHPRWTQSTWKFLRLTGTGPRVRLRVRPI